MFKHPLKQIALAPPKLPILADACVVYMWTYFAKEKL
jgi:hypothetical protein